MKGNSTKMFKISKEEKISTDAISVDDAKINEVRIKVRFGETDMAGMVHHSSYFHWFEQGRFDLLNILFSKEIVDTSDEYFFPVIKARCAYLESAFFGQEVIVQTFMKKQFSTKICLYYRVVDSANPKKTLVMASTEHVCVVNRKNIKLKWSPEILIRIKACYDQYTYAFIEGDEFEKRL